MRLAERHAAPDEHVGDVDRGDHLVGRRARPAARARNVDPAEHPARRRQAQLERVDGVEEVLLVLLHVLVVGQREAVHHAVQRGQVGDDPRRLGAQQLGRVRVLLLRHDRRASTPRRRAPRRSRTPREDHSTISAPSRDRCVAQVAAADRKSSTKSRLETASIEFGDHAREPQLRGHQPPVGRRSSRPPARPRPAAARWSPPSTASKRRGVAAGTSRSRPAGGARGRPAARAAGACSRASPSRGAPRRRRTITVCRSCSASIARSACARVNIAMSVATWSLRERAVCSLPPTGADDLGQPPLDRHVDVLVGVQERELAGVELGLRRGRAPPSSASRSASVMIPAAGEHRRVRARLLDVVGPEAPVEADRGVQRPEDRIRRQREARHRPAIMTNDGSRRPPRAPEDLLRAAAVRVGPAVLRRLRRRRGARARRCCAAVYPRPRPRRQLRALPRRRWPTARWSGVAGRASRCARATGWRGASWRSRCRGCRRGAGRGTFAPPARRRDASRPRPPARRLLRRRARRRPGLAPPRRGPAPARPTPRRRRRAPACAAWRSTPAWHNAPARALYDGLRLPRARDPPRARRRAPPAARRRPRASSAYLKPA